MDNKSVASWTRWIIVLCGIGIVFGLALVFVPRLFNTTMSPAVYNSFYDHDAYAALDEPDLLYQDWVFGVLGATMTGWLLMMGGLAAIPFRNGERWAWNAMTVSLLGWFALDTLTSFGHGVIFNGLVNIGFLIGFGLPLVMTYGRFHEPKD